MKAPKHPVAIACACVAGIALVALVWSRMMPLASGYPDLQGFSSAELCVYPDHNYDEGQTERLTAGEEDLLRTALSNVRPTGWAQDPSSLPSEEGFAGMLFRLTLTDGRVVSVGTRHQHILVEYDTPFGSSEAWAASGGVLASLQELYRQLLAEGTDEP